MLVLSGSDPCLANRGVARRTCPEKALSVAQIVVGAVLPPLPRSSLRSRLIGLRPRLLIALQRLRRASAPRAPEAAGHRAVTMDTGQRRPVPGRPSFPVQEWPIMHRLAFLYLLLPLVIWLLGWFQWWIGLPAVTLLAVALKPVWMGSWRGRPRLTALGLALAALAWVMTTAGGGLFDGRFPNWMDRHVILQTLARNPWPVWLSDPLVAYADEMPRPLLRYYLGWAMVPGLVGHWWGADTLPWAVPLWTWLGTSFVLWLFTRGRRGWGIVGAVALFVFFSGMDVLRLVLEEGWDWLAVNVDAQGWPRITVRRLLEKPDLTTVRLTSHMHIFRGSPQHGLSAWIGTQLLLQLRQDPRFLALSGVLLAAVAFWSPFVAAGLLPLVAVLLWTRGLRSFLAWPNLVLAVLLTGLIALYLLPGTAGFARGWVWERYDWSRLARGLPLLYVTEFALLAFCLAVLRPGLRREPFFIASLITLGLLPWYQYGDGHFLARAALPSLLVLCRCCLDVWARPLRRGAAALLPILGLGALTSLSVLADALQRIDPVIYAQDILAARMTLFDLPWLWQRENIAFAPSSALKTLLRTPEPSRPPPPPGQLVARGAWDIYWEADAHRLVYLKAPCDWTAERADAAEFFLQVLPASRADFGVTWDMEAAGGGSYGLLNTYVRPLGAACSVVRSLPFAPARVRTGQRGRAAGDWSVTLAAGRARGLVEVTARDRRAVQQVLRASEPAVRAAFDVYLAPDAVTLVRAPCREADVRAKFFLHAIPWERSDLPAARQTAGFDNLDFHFPGFAVRQDDQCWAAVPLPSYGIAHLRVGQYAAGTDLWHAEIPFAARVPDALAILRAAYRAAAAQAPAVRDVFDVHVADRTVTFIKAPCRPEDTAAKFILHAVPVQRWRLPANRWRAGFANLSFSLAGHGALFDGVCLARQVLPAYPIARLRVGQFLSAEQRILWQRDLPFPSASASAMNRPEIPRHPQAPTESDPGRLRLVGQNRLAASPVGGAAASGLRARGGD